MARINWLSNRNFGFLILMISTPCSPYKASPYVLIRTADRKIGRQRGKDRLSFAPVIDLLGGFHSTPNSPV